ncbi:MAG TPA: 2-oxo acid dehydrogenase subunit E2, partial [Solirubrobacteraceae bacterium]
MAVGTTVEVTLPQMGESVSEGTVLEWHVAEGDQVSADTTLVEVSTDKVDAEVPAPATGTLVKIHAQEGDTVAVGAVLAEIDTSGPGPSGNGAPPAAEAPAAEEAKTVDIVMPQMGESVSEGTVLEWRKDAGDSVAEDETVVEISTDKVDAEVPAPTAGTITEVLAAAGDTVEVGQVLARMTTTNGAAKAAAATEPAPAPDARPPTPDAPGPTGNGADASPVARRVAQTEGIDLGAITGTGPRGRIVKADVLAAAEGGNGAAAPAGEAQTLKGSAAMLARYMDESRSIPTATSFRTLTVTTMDGRRKQLKAGGQKVSFTHLIAYAIARAAADMPAMAHHFAVADGKPTSVDDHAVNLGIAVDVEKKDGTRTLMVPVIRDAAGLSFADFLAAYNGLIDKARTNTLSADDLVGANISLTNPGGLGTVGSVPRLMVGQGTIVAAGSIAYPVGLGNVGELIGAEKVMTMTSTYDHRIIQGAESGRFLGRIEALLDGEEGFYEDVFSSLGVEVGPTPQPPQPTIQAPEARRPTPDAPSEELLQAVQAATSLLKAHRTHGHLAAKLDPLGLNDGGGDPALDPEPLSLTPQLMRQIPAHILRMYVPGDTLEDALPRLREVYCGPIAYEIEHISSHRQRVWLREKIESSAFRQPLDADTKRWLLRRLIKVDALERFMHKAYLGQKQFSIEGLDMTVPMLDELIHLSGGVGAREVVIGMAHRGRLNVLAHNLGRAYETIFAEFEGASTLEAVTSIPQGGTGDVKYHHGADGSYELRDGNSILVRLESNPSHLEFVSPVVEGATRAAQT